MELEKDQSGNFGGTACSFDCGSAALTRFATEDCRDRPRICQVRDRVIYPQSGRLAGRSDEQETLVGSVTPQAVFDKQPGVGRIQDPQKRIGCLIRSSRSKDLPRRIALAIAVNVMAEYSAQAQIADALSKAFRCPRGAPLSSCMKPSVSHVRRIAARGSDARGGLENAAR